MKKTILKIMAVFVFFLLFISFPIILITIKDKSEVAPTVVEKEVTQLDLYKIELDKTYPGGFGTWIRVVQISNTETGKRHLIIITHTGVTMSEIN
jgi:hypothetical protein